MRLATLETTMIRWSFFLSLWKMNQKFKVKHLQDLNLIRHSCMIGFKRKGSASIGGKITAAHTKHHGITGESRSRFYFT